MAGIFINGLLKKRQKSSFAPLYTEPWVALLQPRICMGSQSGWCCRHTRATAPSTPAWGEAVEHQVPSKHLSAFHPELSNCFSGIYLLFPKRCLLLELYIRYCDTQSQMYPQGDFADTSRLACAINLAIPMMQKPFLFIPK